MSKSKKNKSLIKKVTSVFAIGSSLASGSTLGKMVTKDAYDKIASDEDIIDETEYVEEIVDIEDGLLNKIISFFTED